MVKKRVAALIAAGLVALTAACSSDSDVVSENLSKDADNFKVNRRIVFYNGITGEYMLVIEGFCSVQPDDANRLAVTCKTGKDAYKKHFLGKSDNVTWFAEQIDAANVSANHYKVIFKPSAIIPEPEVR